MSRARPLVSIKLQFKEHTKSPFGIPHTVLSVRASPHALWGELNVIGIFFTCTVSTVTYKSIQNKSVGVKKNKTVCGLFVSVCIAELMEAVNCVYSTQVTAHSIKK